ncbi:MAG: serine/threonine protein kinase [Deltaproteobacteria bacterium]|jgi:serine/threonine-protein kinase|nr:serine/threonine protein kinase [Deltaproteobacteria bacterium]MBW2535893.1 serine/threonine protein kinase [Deltaproteobacteria bacterium]
MELAPGAVVAGDLQLVRPLAQGAMGSVWVAADADGAEYAVKFISSKLSKKRPEALARFKREADAAARIRSRHVVQTHSYGRSSDGTPYIVMELLEGESLGQRLERTGPVPPDVAARIVHQVAEALEAAHTLGIVHRDIKPDNVFLVGSPELPRVKVLDFGTVKQTRTRTDSVVTATGVMVGTPHYMSPEQVLGSRDIDHRSDLWSLGVVAYQALTGVEPFDGPHPQALCLAICRAVYRPATEVRPQLPPEIDGWFERALAPRATERFSSARIMADELADLLLPGGAPTLDEELEITVSDIDEEPTRDLHGEDLIAWLAGQSVEPEASTERRSSREEPDAEPAPEPPQPTDDRSDEEPTQAFHRGVLRAASGADREEQRSADLSTTQSVRAPHRSALLVLAATGALGAVAYGLGWFGPAAVESTEEDTAGALPAPTVSAAGAAGGLPVEVGAADLEAGAIDLDVDDGGRGDRPPGYVTIFCIPACDQVITGGRALGPSPVVRAKLPPGEHEVVLKRRGFADKAITLRVVSDQLTHRRVEVP